MHCLSRLTMPLWALALFCCAGAAYAQQLPAPAHWLAGWTAAPDDVGTPLPAQTIRQIVRTGIGGSSVRVRFSNLLGKQALTISSVHLALHAGAGATLEGSDRLASFAGAGSVTIPAGQSVLSDPVALPVPALAQLVVSLYLPMGAETPTIHGYGAQTAYLLEGQDAAGQPVLAGARTDDSRYFLTDLEVAAAADSQTLLVVGDSVSDGVGSTRDGNARWSDFLSYRLQARAETANISVVNAAIAGNRLLNDYGDPYVGPSTLHRFERDVLSKPGLRWIILLQGINDITAAEYLHTPADQVSAQQIIDAMQQLVAQAHARGITIWAGTLLPRAGASRPLPHNAGMEAKRLAVNQWLRSAHVFDGYIDFDQVLRDPAQPDRQLARLNSGDGSHPNDAGYFAMAQAVDLARLLAR